MIKAIRVDQVRLEDSLGGIQCRWYFFGRYRELEVLVFRWYRELAGGFLFGGSGKAKLWRYLFWR